LVDVFTIIDDLNVWRLRVVDDNITDNFNVWRFRAGEGTGRHNAC
jgi:hypothetical protein